ncbi:hypothetical protein CARUB_v10015170mg [Capsella rubella]|uniref:Uncharacterized protein n=1 Tax=Capsella rubella TaxID=81985 RepID=R0G8S6_9BRAS|nr:hypothetical protein CARUB_v10015170mg [Capsella rubella]
MALQLWMLASVSELEEAYARSDNESDHFPPINDQIKSKEKDLNVISVLGDSSEEEDDDVLMHLLKSDHIFSELDWKRRYALVQHQEDQEVEIGDRSIADHADVDET